MVAPALGTGRVVSPAPVVALVVLLVLLIPVHHFNQQVFQFVNGLHSSLTDSIWLTFTTIGDGMFLTIIMGAFAVKNPRVAAAGLMLLLISGIVVQVIKAAYPTPRPAAVLEAIHVVGPLLRSGSFPSGHTASAIGAALAVWYGYHSRLCGVTAMIVGLLIGFSRIFVGAHFPEDVVGGAVCGLASFMLFAALAWPAIVRTIPDRPMSTRRPFRVALLLETLAAVFAIAVWGPYCAESAPAGIAVGIAVLAFVAHGYWKLQGGRET